MTSPRLVLALLATAGLVHAQEAVAPAEQVPTFAAEIEQVIVDLVVVDKEGDPVSGVTGDDLVVTEDDVAQSVVSFEAVALPDEPARRAAAAAAGLANTGIALDRGRTFVDRLRRHEPDAPSGPATPRPRWRASSRPAVREGDYVNLIATSGGRLVDLPDGGGAGPADRHPQEPRRRGRSPTGPSSA